MSFVVFDFITNTVNEEFVYGHEVFAIKYL